ncbi:MAG: chemotaxis protein CheX [Planctomycetota bacterium]
MNFESLAEGCSDTREEAFQLLQAAADAVIETCEMQLELPLEKKGGAAKPDSGCSTFGSGIALTDATGGYNLMIVGTEQSTTTLTRRLFFMEDDMEVSQDEIADALGELVNVAGGYVKSHRDEGKPDLQLGLPLFLTGSGCIEFLASGVYAAAQPLEGPDDIRLQIIIIWKGSENG